jgi:hypothetical protein
LASGKKSVFEDEDIVHAISNEWSNMNKVSLAEAGDGSPPFLKKGDGTANWYMAVSF